MSDIFSGGYVVPTGGYVGGNALYPYQGFIAAAVVVLIVVLIYFLVVKPKQVDNDVITKSKGGFAPRAPSDLSRKLEERGWKLYTSPTCVWCHKQLNVSSDLKNSKIHTECGPNDDRCRHVTGFPHWENEHTKAVSPGFKTMDQLIAMAEKDFNQLQ